MSTTAPHSPCARTAPVAAVVSMETSSEPLIGHRVIVTLVGAADPGHPQPLRYRGPPASPSQRRVRRLIGHGRPQGLLLVYLFPAIENKESACQTASTPNETVILQCKTSLFNRDVLRHPIGDRVRASSRGDAHAFDAP